ncbi:hypothetical protein [Pseudoroseomonas sp. WGS1072]|uniref:hypothetical protein n=1 Tax=Roseomonas sp. WGS1072 TaxID=3366816 RepID=UPI003BEFA39B
MIQICMVAGANAISYAEHAIESLFRNCAQDFSFALITDKLADKVAYETVLSRLAPRGPIQVVDEDYCDRMASEFFKNHPNVQRFRKGHPCWRKITDPSLIAPPGADIIVLDPDIYFPNRFLFEATRPGQLLLMRQQRHCLLPDHVVQTAFRMKLSLAHHTDIGVAQHTALPWDWIDQVIVQLGGEGLPRVPHIESILWAAIAMKIGGGYLDSKKWSCWERTAVKRLLMIAGIQGALMLRLEKINAMKCFHASSGAKDWLVEGYRRGLLQGNMQQLEPSPVEPYIELTQQAYQKGERLKARYHAILRAVRLRDPLRAQG